MALICDKIYKYIDKIKRENITTALYLLNLIHGKDYLLYVIKRCFNKITFIEILPNIHKPSLIHYPIHFQYKTVVTKNYAIRYIGAPHPFTVWKKSIISTLDIKFPSFDTDGYKKINNIKTYQSIRTCSTAPGRPGSFNKLWTSRAGRPGFWIFFVNLIYYFTNGVRFRYVWCKYNFIKIYVFIIKDYVNMSVVKL